MRKVLFRTLSGLLGLLFIWCYFNPGLKAPREQGWLVLIVAIAFLIHALQGEHPLVYAMFGITAADQETPPSRQEEPGEPADPRSEK